MFAIVGKKANIITFHFDMILHVTVRAEVVCFLINHFCQLIRSAMFGAT